MTEGQEPSYYEIALTNRQVVSAFVILLGCVFVAFLAGVWVGRGGSGQVSADPVQVAEAPGSSGELEEFKFFSEADQPAPGLPVEPAPDTTLAEDVESTRAEGDRRRKRPGREGRGAEEPAAREPEPVRTPEPEPEVAPAPPPAVVAEPKPTPKPPPASTPTTPEAATDESDEPWIVQVLSTSDEGQARALIDRLESGGLAPFLSPAPHPELANQLVYRVRLGPYDDRTEAERVGERLKREFRVDTWITH